MSVATLPAAVFVAEELERTRDDYSLLEAGLAIPLAVGLGLFAVVLGRGVRRRGRYTLAPVRGARVARWGRGLGYLGLYVGVTAALAFGVYGLLTYVA